MIADDIKPEQAETQLDQKAYPNTPAPGALSMPPSPTGPPPLNPSMMPNGARPMSSSNPPQNLPTGYPVMNAQLSNAMQRGGDVFPGSMPGYQQQQIPDSGQLVNIASPVGSNYGQQVDWAQAAAAPAHALPKWKLIAMFVGAIFGAFLIILIIAKIAS
jgi:hypothetical protein